MQNEDWSSYQKLILAELERLSEGQIDLNRSLNQNNITLATQGSDLKEHMRRTALLEESVSMIRNEIKPLQRASTLLSGLMKLFGILGGIFAALAALKELFWK